MENATSLGAAAALALRAGQTHHANQPRWHVPASSDQYYLPIPTPAVALSCFATKCVHGSFLSGLHPLYNDIRAGSPLSIALYAPALASLAIDSQQPSIMTLAHSQYSQAVRRTKQALSDPKEYLTDDTLASVLLLGLFEVISYDEETVQTSWNAHLSGALEIVKLRGTAQFNTRVGLELYVAVLLGIRSICLQRQTKLPQWVMDFECNLAELLDAHPTYHGRHIFDKFSEIQQMQKSGDYSAAEMINTCLQLDDAINSACARKSTMNSMGTMPADKHEILKSRSLNTLRVIRIQLNCWVQEHISQMEPALNTTSSEGNTQLYSKAHETMKVLAAEILDSAQKFLIPPVTLNSRFMVFYLYTVVQQPLIPHQLRACARELIRVLGTEGKIPEALRVTERLDIQREHDEQQPSFQRPEESNKVRNLLSACQVTSPETMIQSARNGQPQNRQIEIGDGWQNTDLFFAST